MRCDLCLIYRPNVEQEDRRAEICPVFEQMAPGFHADPQTIICDGCACTDENAVLLDPSCEARRCVLAKGFPHCGHCSDYPCSIFPRRTLARGAGANDRRGKTLDVGTGSPAGSL